MDPQRFLVPNGVVFAARGLTAHLRRLATAHAQPGFCVSALDPATYLLQRMQAEAMRHANLRGSSHPSIPQRIAHIERAIAAGRPAGLGA